MGNLAKNNRRKRLHQGMKGLLSGHMTLPLPPLTSVYNENANNKLR